jgi:hypothetical protein
MTATVRSRATTRASAAPPAAHTADENPAIGSTAKHRHGERHRPDRSIGIRFEERPDGRQHEQKHLRVDALEERRLPHGHRPPHVGPSQPPARGELVGDHEQVRRTGHLERDLEPGSGLQERSDAGRDRNEDDRDPEHGSDHVRKRPPEPEPHPRRPQDRVVRARRHRGGGREGQERNEVLHRGDRTPPWFRRSCTFRS